MTDPDGFDRHAAEPYPVHRNVSVVSLIVPQDSVISAHATVTKLRTLPSVWDVLGDVEPGQRVPRTIDLFTSPGFLYLVADNEAAINRDYSAIRALEANGLYMPAP